MITGIIIVVIVVIVIGAVVIGVLIGSSGNADAVRPGDNQTTDNCDQNCNQWQQRKGELCDAERAEKDAKERSDMLNSLVLAVAGGVISVVVALLGSAGLLALLSALGVPAIVAAALLLGGLAVAILGAIVLITLGAAATTAYQVWSTKQRDTQRAEVAETTARGILNNSCSQDEVAACVANSPC